MAVANKQVWILLLFNHPCVVATLDILASQTCS